MRQSTQQPAAVGTRGRKSSPVTNYLQTDAGNYIFNEGQVRHNASQGPSSQKIIFIPEVPINSLAIEPLYKL